VSVQNQKGRRVDCSTGDYRNSLQFTSQKQEEEEEEAYQHSKEETVKSETQPATLRAQKQ
jgi:hypothetical protein